MERIEWYKDIIDHPDYYSATVDFAYNTIDSYKLTLTKDRWTDISYDSLKTHPLFIHDRKDFTVRQWQKDKPKGLELFYDEDTTEEGDIDENSTDN